MWIYLVTVPLAIKDDNKRIRVQESAAYRNFGSFINEFMYLIVIVNLIQPLIHVGENKGELTDREVDIHMESNRSDHYKIGLNIAKVGTIAAKDFMTCAVIGLAYFIFTTLGRVN